MTKKDNAVTIRISKEARQKLKIASAQAGLSLIDYVNKLLKVK